jgi:hypothetical protein
MLYTIIVKTALAYQVVQIVMYRNGKRFIFKNTGYGRTNEKNLSFKIIAQDIIDNYSFTFPFFEDLKSDNLSSTNKNNSP